MTRRAALRLLDAPQIIAGARARFISKVGKPDDRGCTIWTGTRPGFGYGRFKMFGKMWHANRAAWELFVGPIPAGQLVLHKCDVPGCVNIDHLFLGTDAENLADMDRKGRRSNNISWLKDVKRNGEHNSRAKLSESDALSILERYSKGERVLQKMAEEFGVSKPTVASLVYGRSWRHLPRPTGVLPPFPRKRSVTSAEPAAANDDAPGAFCARSLCTRCQARPAFLRIDSALMLCSDCLSESDVQLHADVISHSSFADGASSGEIAVAAETPAPGPSAAAAANSDSASVNQFPPDASSKLATLRQDAVFSSADAGPYGFGLMQFGCPLCLRIDCEWTHGPHPDFNVKYAATSASFAASDSASNDISKSVAASN